MDKTQRINFTLYPQHLVVIDNVSRHELRDPRGNRSQALRFIINKFAEMYWTSKWQDQSSAASDRRQVGRPSRQEQGEE